MNVYKFDEVTKEYLGVELAEIDPLESKMQNKTIYILPANATFIAPVDAQEGYVNVWNDIDWEQIQDNRGVEYWLPEDVYGAPAKIMKDLGALPEGALLNPPEQTQEEKNRELADNAKVILRSLAIDAMMMTLAGNDVTTYRNEYQTNIMTLNDDVALLMPEVYPIWSGNSVNYKKGERITYKGILYKVLQDHTSQGNWTPEAAPSLFAKVLTSTTGEILEWEQPDSTNPYMKGDKVKYNGKIYESLIDNNVWAPDAYPLGWKEIKEV